MTLRERFFKFTDAPFTWTRAILIGSAIWIYSIIFMGQIPSLIIYKFDQYVAEIIDFTTKIPGVNDDGLNTQQIKMIRDIVNNGFQLTALAILLIFMYFWQETKRKRTGAKSLEDPVKGYMSGK